MRVGNVDQLVVVFEIEVVMRRHVGIEIGLGAVDADLAQQARIGQLIERVVDGRERHRNLGESGFLVQHFRGEVASSLAEQKPPKRHPLTGRAQAGRLQHFVDIVPGTTGQRRLPPAMGGRSMGSVIIHSRTVVAHFHVGHHAGYRALSQWNIRRKYVRCKFFATSADLRGTRSWMRRFTRAGALPSEGAYGRGPADPLSP